MQTIVRRRIPVAVVLATLLAGGCMASKPPAAISPFFTSCKDLDALVTRTASGTDCELKDKSPSSSEGGRARGHLHHHSSLVCNIDGKPEATKKLLLALKAEVESLAKKAGAEIIDTSEGKGVGGHLASFEINYGIGNAHGKFKANIEPGQIAIGKKPDKPATNGHLLKVQIEEWAG